MRGYIILCGILLTVLPGGCGGVSSLPDLDVTQTGTLSEPVADENAAELADATEEGMPLPVRNTIRAGIIAEAEQSDGEGLFSLPDLPDVEDLATASAEPSIITQWKETPVGVYTILARQIHSCWLNVQAPKLKNHGLHAEVASGNADKALIVIYKKNKEGRRDFSVFRIEIHSGFTGSSVEVQNRKLNKDQDFEFREDIARWSQGDQQCGV